MSNWYRVIVTWSGIDDEVPDHRPSIAHRAYRVSNSEQLDMRAVSIVYPCPVGDDSACETVVVYAANHFAPEEAQKALRQMKWEKPEEVQLFWKGEDDHVYKSWTLAPPPWEDA